MSAPTKKHRERAIVIYDALGRGSTRDEETIARALAASEREGIKRAAVIVQSSGELWGEPIESQAYADAILSECGVDA